VAGFSFARVGKGSPLWSVNVVTGDKGTEGDISSVNGRHANVNGLSSYIHSGLRSARVDVVERICSSRYAGNVVKQQTAGIVSNRYKKSGRNGPYICGNGNVLDNKHLPGRDANGVRIDPC
jgi:hypothetical protein